MGSKARALLQGLATWGAGLDQGFLLCPRPPPGSGSLPRALGLGPGFTLSWGPAGDGEDLTGARNRKQPRAKV